MSRLTDALDERFTDLDEIKDVANYGCEAGVSGFIYYNETRQFFFKYEDEIHDVIDEDFGFKLFIEESDSDSLTQLINNMVWFVVEDYCRLKMYEAEELATA